MRREGAVGGYRDVQLNVRFNGNIKIVWELQLHLASITAIKTGQFNSIQIKPYHSYRLSWLISHQSFRVVYQ